jgi:AcrR family transcriptional regulator
MSTSSETPTARERRGADTRRRVEEAAATLFTTRGYSATSVKAIAAAANVHEQTIYLAYGTKAAVLAACATRLVAGDEDPESHPSERRWVQEIQAESDPRRKIELYVAHIAEVAPRITALTDVLRTTAPSEPEAAAFLAHMEEGRREGPLRLLGPLAGTPALRPGLSADDVADITYSLASPDTLRAFATRGWTPRRAQEWIADALALALLAREDSVRVSSTAGR